MRQAAKRPQHVVFRRGELAAAPPAIVVAVAADDVGHLQRGPIGHGLRSAAASAGASAGQGRPTWDRTSAWSGRPMAKRSSGLGVERILASVTCV